MNAHTPLRHLMCGIVVVAALPFAARATAMPTRREASALACRIQATSSTVRRFIDAFNAGDVARLDRLIASRGRFGGYTVYGRPGKRTGKTARARSTLLRYLISRHRHTERLVLTRLVPSTRSQDARMYWLELVRTADDIDPSVLYVGHASVTCSRPHRLANWTIKPNPSPNLPAAESYADSCRLVASWCSPGPHPGAIPATLRRPLAIPGLRLDGSCPVTAGQPFSNGQFGGVALGTGPVQPLIPPTGGNRRAAAGILTFGADPLRRGWYRAKTLWFAPPTYDGAVYIRGRQIDGPHVTIFGESPVLADPQLPPGPTLNGMDGWREWPGATWLRTPGCYAWQIDGTDFSEVIVFEARFRPTR